MAITAATRLTAPPIAPVDDNMLRWPPPPDQRAVLQRRQRRRVHHLGSSSADYPGVQPVGDRGRRHLAADRRRRAAARRVRLVDGAQLPLQRDLHRRGRLHRQPAGPGSRSTSRSTAAPAAAPARYPQPSYQAGVVPTSLSEVNSLRADARRARHLDGGRPGDRHAGRETQAFPNGVYYDQYRIGGTSVASPLLAGVIARADQTAGHSLGFINPALYSLRATRARSTTSAPAGKQDQSRADYANSLDPIEGLLYPTRIIDYEGPEQYCSDPAEHLLDAEPARRCTRPGLRQHDRARCAELGLCLRADRSGQVGRYG